MLIRFCTLVAMLFLGCSHPAMSQTIASKVEYVGTSQYLSITGLKTREVNGLLNLIVEIANSDTSDQEGYYRMEWFDADGFPAWGEEAWKPILLHGSQRQKLQVIAPTIKALDFKIVFSGDRNWANNPSPGQNQ